MRHLPPLAAVRAFEAAARHGNFTKAAEELGMTQAAISYQVKLLEERVGTPLFHRVRRQVMLTEAGRRIAPLISGAFDTLDDAFAIARAESESVLTISCSNTFASNWLAMRLGGFQMERPGLAVRLRTDDDIVDFARDEVDVAIRNSIEPWPGLVSHFLMRVPIVPMASPAFLDRHGPVETPEDVLRLPRMSPDDIWWKVWLEGIGLAVPERGATAGVRLDSQVMEGNAAIAGHGIAILNMALWMHEVRARRLLPAPRRIVFGRRSYWLTYPEGKRNAAKVKAFRAWIEAEMRRDAEEDEDGVFDAPPSP
ncbi:LysR substrate-binding domain-containing protein [Allosphingosinicella indica]|uniref:Transcriptional regulator n=1 Tax=Allosphingosinicella indica TaxID=941907 RepID=A0A1X7G082_9SPHN|nr:LysR substrate-binding domain-containing protein [Allosphingosinicella indica]SMF61790.1 transcriptional regulator [Allosphingosinicella indica]